MKWIDARKRLPKRSGEYLVGVVGDERNVFYHIASLPYSALHKKFNAYDFNSKQELKGNRFDNNFCYWMPLPKPPKEDA